MFLDDANGDVFSLHTLSSEDCNQDQQGEASMCFIECHVCGMPLCQIVYSFFVVENNVIISFQFV
jgi:hypothetical protein